MMDLDAEKLSQDISDVKKLDIPVLVIFFILFLSVALQFFTRYVLNDSLSWTEEIARYLLIMVGFAGSVVCVRSGGHIFLEFAHRHMQPIVLRLCFLFVDTMETFFWGYLSWLCVDLAQRSHSNMVSINLPKSYLYYFVVVCCVAMAIHACVRLIKRLNVSEER